MSTMTVLPPAEALPQSSAWKPVLNFQLVFDGKSSQLTYKAAQMTKRLFDLAASSIGLLLLSPMLLTIALLIKLTSPGPVVYKSPRVGRKGELFYMYKFRTMCTNADALRDKLREENGLQGELFKISNDPRITPIGHLLRKYSLDEFPQLFNVIRGEMSLVGPRPLPPDESAMFEEPYTLRFNVLPGVTGLWQVSGRSNLSFKQLCELELSYTLNWNLINDLRILFKTIPAVLIRKGAY